jgi:hypothetical protein
MDSYLSKVKKSDEKEKKTVAVEEKMEKENVEEFKEEEKAYMAGKKSFFQKFMDFIAGTEEEEQKTEEEKTEDSDDEKELEKYDKKNKGLFGSVKGLFSRDTKAAEQKEEKKEETTMMLPEDIKEVLRIQNKWLMMLPARTIREFKESDDYRIYKETLLKYGLIKAK